MKKNKWLAPTLSIVLLSALAFGCVQPHIDESEPPPIADIVLLDEGFDVEIFATFINKLDDSGDKPVFGLVFNYEDNDFPIGLYATSGFYWDQHVTGTDVRLITGRGEMELFVTGFKSSGMPAFTSGEYGNYLIIPDSHAEVIYAVDASRNITVFCDTVVLPTAVTYLPEDVASPWRTGVYALDGLESDIYLLSPEGVAEYFSPASEPTPAALSLGNERFGNFLYTVIYTDWNFMPGKGYIGRISPQGEQDVFLSGFDGLEGLAFAPDGPFGGDMYVTSIGLITPFPSHNDGAIYRITPEGQVSLFAEGLDATGIVFDTEGLFGGGMFVADKKEASEGEETVYGYVYRIFSKD